MTGTALQIERGGFYRPDFNRSSESHENPYFSSSSLSYKLYIEKALPAQEGYLPNTEVFGNRPWAGNGLAPKSQHPSLQRRSAMQWVRNTFILLLVAYMQLWKSLCWSGGWLVCWLVAVYFSFVGGFQGLSLPTCMRLIRLCIWPCICDVLTIEMWLLIQLGEKNEVCTTSRKCAWLFWFTGMQCYNWSRLF